MDEDDLPPRPLRELAGGSLWIALFLAAAGSVLYFLLHTTH